jgi:hypothetical protein
MTITAKNNGDQKMINERTNEEVLDIMEIEEMEEVFAPGIMLTD